MGKKLGANKKKSYIIDKSNLILFLKWCIWPHLEVDDRNWDPTDGTYNYKCAETCIIDITELVVIMDNQWFCS
jgi:hypothetical protein